MCCNPDVIGSCGRPQCDGPPPPDRAIVLALERSARRLSTLLTVARCSHSEIDLAQARELCREVGALGEKL